MVSFFDSEKSHSLLDIDDNRTITSHSETLSEESSFLDENVQQHSSMAANSPTGCELLSNLYLCTDCNN